jgi:uncharacterized membrane protein
MVRPVSEQPKVFTMTNTECIHSPGPSKRFSPEQSTAQTTLLHGSAPFRWLRLGWSDLASQPFASFFCGLPFLCMALILDAVFLFEPEYAMMAAPVCLLIGPFVAMGLYDISRRREAGLTPDFLGSLTCWQRHLRSIGMLTGLLLVLELLWGRASLLVTALFFNTIIPSDFDVMGAALDAGNWDFFMAYTVVAIVFAALVFSIAIVSVPMILDRDTDAITAAIASLKVVQDNVGVMLLWSVLIAVMVGVSLLLPMAAGLAVVGPLLGHASWHAYREAVRWP